MLDIVAYVYLHLLLTCFNSNPLTVFCQFFSHQNLSTRPLNWRISTLLIDSNSFSLN